MERNDKSIPELIRDLANQVSNLVRHEIDLARAEVAESASRAGNGAGMLAGALIVGIGAVVILLQAAVAMLGEAMETWLAALIVGVIAALVAWAMASKGRSDLRARNLIPERAIHSVRTDARYAREKVQ